MTHRSDFHAFADWARWCVWTLIVCHILGFPLSSARAEGNSLVLTLLHSDDGESQLLHAGNELEDFGGITHFVGLMKRLQREALEGGGRRGLITLSSGDNFRAGPEFTASLEKGVPFFDAIALDQVGYDAIAIGNHEFDFGPELLADFIQSFRSRSAPPFLSANLDVSQEPSLQALVATGRIAKSTVVFVADTERVGIIGVTTPQLSSISSPRNATVRQDVAAAVQTEIDRLTASGVNKIILMSNLQSIQEDFDLAPMLRDVDIIVAGGGDHLLANINTNTSLLPGFLGFGDRLLPGDEAEVVGPYPLITADANGNTVLVVTTSGEYRYIGRLVVTFDRSGRLTGIDEAASGPILVTSRFFDYSVEVLVNEPVQAAVDAFASHIIGTSEVPLNGLRSDVRTQETNEGNLIADALLFEATQQAAAFNAPAPDVALQNGGGIRNQSIIEPGNLTELETFDIAPFPNFVTLVPAIPASQFKEILENAVSQVEVLSGRFAQISGFRLVWDPNGTPQEIDETGNIITPGTRVVDITLDDGQQIVSNGQPVAGAPALNIATIDFLARGGDQYPYRGASFISLGVSYQQALVHYITNGLGGVVTAAQYPVGGEGRIRQ